LSEENDSNEIVESNIPKTSENITIKKSTYSGLIIGVIVAVGVVAFLGGLFISNSDSGDYITKSDMEEILSKLESKLDNVQAPTTTQQQAPPPSIISVSLDDDPVKGNPDASVVIVEFSDFQCPFCSRFYHQTLPLIQENYIDTGKVKLVYRDLPLDSLHPNARPAHIASECADEQGMFWQYHDILFENQAQWNRLGPTDLNSALIQYAHSLGLNSTSFESCLGSQTIADEVNADYLQGISYGATGTPTFFIGNEDDGFIKLVGAQPYAVFQQVIDSQLG